MGSAPCNSRRSLTSGRLMMRTTSRLILLMMSFGVPAGANKASQEMDSYSGTPDSATVATLGEASERFALVTASARRRPDFTCGRVSSTVAKDTGTWPASRSATAGPPPL